MRLWNVILTINQWHFRAAFRLLRPLGAVGRTRFYNVLTMHVDDLEATLEALKQLTESDERAAETICRVAPVTDVFGFTSDESFVAGACEVLARWLPQLAGRTFHVRVHRRGGPLEITSYAAERLLGGYVWQELQRANTPARVSFDDPDAIVNVETVEDRAGLALWTREQLARYPFLRE
jgi:tRNA(Ser,Leu) C12 N-acetylase TAN1